MQVLDFAWLRERIGLGAETVDLPAGVTTVSGLVAFLAGRSAGHAAAFAPDTAGLVRCAVNQVFAQPDWPVGPGDEVAFFPPVTGG